MPVEDFGYRPPGAAPLPGQQPQPVTPSSPLEAAAQPGLAPVEDFGYRPPNAPPLPKVQPASPVAQHLQALQQQGLFPDAAKAADVLHISAASGYPAEVVADPLHFDTLRRTYLPDPTKGEQGPQPDWALIERAHPEVFNFAAKGSEQAALVQDASAQLTGLDYALWGGRVNGKYVPPMLVSRLAAVPDRYRHDALLFWEDFVRQRLLGKAPDPENQARLRELAALTPAGRDYGIDHIDSWWAKLLAEGAAFTVDMLPDILLTLASGGAGGVIGAATKIPRAAKVGGVAGQFLYNFFITAGGTSQAMHQVEAETGNQQTGLGTALTLGASTAVAATMTGGLRYTLGLAGRHIAQERAKERAVEGLLKSGALKAVFWEQAKHVPHEVVSGTATLVTMAVEQAVAQEALRANLSSEPFRWHEVGTAALQSLEHAAVGMSFMSLVSIPSRRFLYEIGHAQALEAAHERQRQALENARKLPHPEAMTEVVDAQAKAAGIDVFYVETEHFEKLVHQKGGEKADPRAVAEKAGFLKEYEQAKAQGTEIPVPAGVYLTKLAFSKQLGLGLHDISRTADADRTPRQAREEADFIRKSVEGLRAAYVKEGKPDPYTAIVANALSRFDAAGIPKLEAEANAVLEATKWTFLAGQSNQDPVALYNQEMGRLRILDRKGFEHPVQQKLIDAAKVAGIPITPLEKPPKPEAAPADTVPGVVKPPRPEPGAAHDLVEKSKATLAETEKELAAFEKDAAAYEGAVQAWAVSEAQAWADIQKTLAEHGGVVEITPEERELGRKAMETLLKAKEKGVVAETDPARRRAMEERGADPDTGERLQPEPPRRRPEPPLSAEAAQHWQDAGAKPATDLKKGDTLRSTVKGKERFWEVYSVKVDETGKVKVVTREPGQERSSTRVFKPGETVQTWERITDAMRREKAAAEEARLRADWVEQKTRLKEEHGQEGWSLWDEGAPPAWVKEQTGVETRGDLQRKYGAGARFVKPLTRGEKEAHERQMIARAEHFVVTPGTEKQGGEKVRYELAEADDLIPSHNYETLDVNTAYPVKQQRGYHTSDDAGKQARLRVTAPEGGFQPERQFERTSTPTEGPPLVTSGEKRFVLGGNRRTMMLLRSFDTEGGVEKYRELLKKNAAMFGIDPKQVDDMERPVLVRRVLDVTSEAGETELSNAINRYNETNAAALSPAEQGISAGKAMPEGTIRNITAILNIGDLSLREAMSEHGAEIAAILRGDGTLNAANEQKFVQGGTSFTEEGKALVESALLGRVVGDLDRLTRTAPSVKKKLERIVAPLLRVESAAPEADLIPLVQKGLDYLIQAKTLGIKLGSKESQGNVMEAPGVDTDVLGMAILLQDGKQLDIAERFRLYAAAVTARPLAEAAFAARQAELHPAGQGAMFDLGPATPPKLPPQVDHAELMRMVLRGETAKLEELAAYAEPAQELTQTKTQPAVHGTHTRGIDRFDIRFIGSGEGGGLSPDDYVGMQGWGLYFAQNEAVGENYRKALAARAGIKAREQWELAPPGERDPLAWVESLSPEERQGWSEIHARAYWSGRRVGGKGLVADLRRSMQSAIAFHREEIKRRRAELERFGIDPDKEFPSEEQTKEERASRLEMDKSRWAIMDAEAGLGFLERHPELVAVPPQEAGQLYQVDVPEMRELLDWDRPMSEQPEAVRAILQRERGPEGARLQELAPVQFAIQQAFAENATGEELYRKLVRAHGYDRVGQINVRKSLAAKGASLALGRMGIPGHRYLDQGSRYVPEPLFDGEKLSAALPKHPLFSREGNALEAVWAAWRDLGPAGKDEITKGDLISRARASLVSLYGEGSDNVAALDALTPQIEVPDRTRNFVIWDDSRVHITGTRYQPSLVRVKETLQGQFHFTKPGTPLQLRVIPEGKELRVVLLGFGEGVREDVAAIEKYGHKGDATSLYLRALEMAQKDGLGFASDNVRSDATERMYARLLRLGVPFKLEGEGLSSQYRISPDDLAAVDLNRSWLQLQREAAYEEATAKDVHLSGGATIRIQNAVERGWLQTIRDVNGNIVRRDLRLANPDKSTLAHELFHLFIDVMGETSDKPEATQMLKDVYKTFLRTMGYADHADRMYQEAEWTRLESKQKKTPADWKRLKELQAKEEKLTHLWEQFLYEGKAPSMEMLPLFARFKKWFSLIYREGGSPLDTYRDVYHQELELTDPVRNAFRTILAGENAVADAERMLEGELPRVVLTPQEQEEDQKKAALEREVAQAAVERVLNENKTAAAREFFRGERERLVREADERIGQERTYRAIESLQKGDANGTKGKLDRAAVVQEFGEDVAKGLPKDIYATGPTEEALSPDVAATALGFDSAKDMVTMMGAAAGPARARRAAREAAQRMRELYPMLEERGDYLHQVATKELSRGFLGRLLVRLRALAREAGMDPRLTSPKDIMEGAREAAAKIPYEQNRPGFWDAQATSRARNEARLDDKGKRYDNFEQYTLNRAMRVAVEDAREQHEGHAKFLNKYVNDPKTLQELGKAFVVTIDANGVEHVDQPFLRHVQALLEEFDFTGTSKRAVKDRSAQLRALEDWAEERRVKFGDQMEISDKVRKALARTMSWRELSLEEIQALRTAVEDIQRAADNQRWVTIAGKKVETETAIREMREQARSTALSVPLQDPKNAEELETRVRRWGRQLLGVVKRPALHLYTLDGGKEDGPFYRYLFKPLSDGTYRFYDLVRETADKVNAELRAVPWETRKKWQETFEVDGHKFNGENIVRILTYLGTASGEDKLVRGMSQKWLFDDFGYIPWEGRDTIDRILSHATEEHVRLAQSLVRTMESLWPLARDLDIKDFGKVPKKEEARPYTFVGADGKTLTMEGGYSPIVFDKDLIPGHLRHQLDFAEQYGAKGLFDPNYEAMNTPRSYLMERTGFVGPLDLTLDAIPRHLVGASKDIAIRLPAKQLHRLLLDSRLAGAITQAIGADGYRQIQDWARDAVNDVNAPEQGAGIAKRILYQLRKVTTESVFGANVAQTLQNLADVVGITGSGALPARYFAKASMELTQNMDALVAQMKKESGEMRLRFDGWHNSATKGMRQVFREGRTQATWEEFKAVTMKPFELTQLLCEGPAYLGAKEHALDMGMSPEKAIEYAENLIRDKFGGRRTMDLPPVMREQTLRWFTMFHGWANAQLNAFIKASTEARNLAVKDGKVEWTPELRAKAFGIMAHSFVALWLQTLISELLVGHGPDDDENGKPNWAWWAAYRGLVTLPSFMPFVGPVVRATEARGTRDVSLTPWANSGNVVAKSAKLTKAMFENQDDPEKKIAALMAWIELGGTAIGAPVAQLRQTVGYWTDPNRDPNAPLWQDVMGTTHGKANEGKLLRALQER